MAVRDPADWVRLLGAWTERKGSLHRRLSDGIREAIERGLLAQGMRVPSERDLARALGLSRNTVVAAYNALRDDRWLESRTGGGTWICKASFAVRDAQEEIRFERLAQSNLFGFVHQEADSAIDFASGTPFPLKGLPADVFRLPEAEHEWLMGNRLYYPYGYPALREAIAAHYSSSRLPTTPEQILVTGGAQQAILLIASLFLQRGDAALIEDPCYAGALEAFQSLGARVETMPVGAHGIDPKTFRGSMNASNARLVFLTPTFQNPTGVVMPARAREEIVAAAAERTVAIIDDRTFAEIELDPIKPVPMPLAAWDRQDTVLTVGSLGKLIWAGLRIGWIRAARHLIERLVRVKMIHDLGTPLITQALAARMLPFHREAVSLRRAELLAKRDLVASMIVDRLPGWTFDLPSGGLFLWTKLPSGDARELAQVAMRHGVILRPGSSLSLDQRYTDTLRIPYLVDEAELREGMDRLVDAWGEHTRARPRRVVAQTII
jgi:DNA-binding transcriptional MocR family regulator